MTAAPCPSFDPYSHADGQAVLNALVYSGALQGTLTIGSYHRGLVKTVDVGGLRDAHGRFYNERGAPYALVHQFRRTRHPQFFEELERIFPSGLPDAAWRAVLFGRARQALLQRVPMVWDQAARCTRAVAFLCYSSAGAVSSLMLTA
jgi:hypothetical protein